MIHDPLTDLHGVQRLGEEMTDFGQTFRGLPAPLGGSIETRIMEGNCGKVGQPLQDGLIMVGERARPRAAHVQ